MSEAKDLAFSLPSFATEELLKKEDRESWNDLLFKVRREPTTSEHLRDISRFTWEEEGKGRGGENEGVERRKGK